MPYPRAFQASPGRRAFVLSTHGSRNNSASQIQMVAALLMRAGFGKLWFTSASSVGTRAVGPMYNPSGSPTAIDPLFLVGQITWTWSGTAIGSGASLAQSATATITIDPKYGDCTVVLTSTYGASSTDTNTAILNVGGLEWIDQTGIGSGFFVPGQYVDTTVTPNDVYEYDTGDFGHLTSHSETNGSMSCSANCVYPRWLRIPAGGGTGNYYRVALTVTWSLTSPYLFRQYVKLCDQLLAGATLLDVIANPTKTYSDGLLITTEHLRYPNEFQQWADGSATREVCNSLVVGYDRSAGYNYGFGWTGAPGAGGINDGGVVAALRDPGAASSPWISTIAETDVRPGVIANYLYNFNNNPMFAHGCPVTSGNAPYFSGLIYVDSIDIATPLAPTDNVSAIMSLKSAFTTKKITSSTCWSYDPSANAYTSQTFAPGSAATMAGGFIFDPVKNLAVGDVPAGYVLDPSSGLYTVDTTSPFTSANVDSLFGFVTGDY